MPTLVKEMDPNLAYMFCIVCRSQGNSKSPLTRDGTGAIRCGFGHGPFTLDQLMNSDMVPATELFVEQPTITDVKKQVWVNPEVWARLERKFANRFMITIATYLAAIADDSIVMITGEQAGKLRALGITNGQQILSTVEMAKQTERELDESNKTIQKFMGLIAAAQAPEA